MDVLRDELKTAIRLEHDKGNDMMIVAHSMGSIIAYDALRDLGREPDNAIRIEHLVTIGSPLGLPHVKGKILEERDYAEEVRTPSVVVGGWTNFADLKDPVALDSRLKDDYAANQLGIRVVGELAAARRASELPGPLAQASKERPTRFGNETRISLPSRVSS